MQNELNNTNNERTTYIKKEPRTQITNGIHKGIKNDRTYERPK